MRGCQALEVLCHYIILQPSLAMATQDKASWHLSSSLNVAVVVQHGSASSTLPPPSARLDMPLAATCKAFNVHNHPSFLAGRQVECKINIAPHPPRQEDLERPLKAAARRALVMQAMQSYGRQSVYSQIPLLFSHNYLLPVGFTCHLIQKQLKHRVAAPSPLCRTWSGS